MLYNLISALCDCVLELKCAQREHFFFVIHFQAEVFFFVDIFVQYLLKRRSDMRHESVDRAFFFGFMKSIKKEF